MKSNNVKALAAIVGMILAGSAAAAGKPLVSATDTLAKAANEPALESLLSSASTAQVRLVQVDASAVDEAQIEIELDGRVLTANRNKVERAETGETVWYGNFGPKVSAKTRSGIDPLNSAILVRSGDTVTGTLRSGGKLYRVRPLPGGEHAIVEVDESRLPQDHPHDYNRLPTLRMAAPAEDGKVGALGIPPGPTATIRVMVVATNQAVSGYGGNMQSLIQLAVAESNQGYINSNVGINLVLASYSTTTYTESGNFSTDLARFRGTSDGYMDNIHTIRNNTAADVGVIVLNNSSYCGLASGIGSTAATAFASVYWDCATGYYSFAHEIGHLQSARHDPATDPSTSPYAYGHGYRWQPATGARWRTIMAYNCSPSCTRLNYWSNPSISYGGVPMGTATQSDNQRVLVNTKATVAGFR
ncbi:zinc-dependent metalloprotease [Lysobacter silvisoli]|uniref:Peptidyl-Asp metalloendopeptidase n=1 Tax=Lysobacter silvisoli TaxID=2293254 RepID=A0A371K474_9GAMM|nr:zinc-dependent metalloprotease [Lysobacter silvisoli]RDZ28723.1 hypothetical protein DX914_06255 [Lysobacter silvisoli]